MKTNLDEINRNVYDIKNKDEYDFKIQKGLTKEIIEEISKQKTSNMGTRFIRIKYGRDSNLCKTKIKIK